MTFSELSSAATLLGFNDTEFPTGLLRSAVNCALGEIYTALPVYRSIRFAAGGLTPLLYKKEICVTPGDVVEYTVQGYSYSVKIHGTCNFMIRYEGDVNLINVETGSEAKHFKGLIFPGSIISFWSNYAFNIFDLAIYDRVSSLDPEDIPEGGPITYFDLRRIYGDYMSFVGPATDVYGVPLKNCRLIDGRIEIDSTHAGEVLLTYRRLPTLCVGEENEEIDLPKEYLCLLPLLTAAYLWLGIEEARAKYYRSLYDSLLKNMQESGYHAIGGIYEITDGWS